MLPKPMAEPEAAKINASFDPQFPLEVAGCCSILSPFSALFIQAVCLYHLILLLISTLYGYGKVKIEVHPFF
jgi:hypothetical protein